jgi:hypothetical protein
VGQDDEAGQEAAAAAKATSGVRPDPIAKPTDGGSTTLRSCFVFPPRCANACSSVTSAPLALVAASGREARTVSVISRATSSAWARTSGARPSAVAGGPSRCAVAWRTAPLVASCANVCVCWPAARTSLKSLSIGPTRRRASDWYTRPVARGPWP